MITSVCMVMHTVRLKRHEAAGHGRYYSQCHTIKIIGCTDYSTIYLVCSSESVTKLGFCKRSEGKVRVCGALSFYYVLEPGVSQRPL